MAKKSFWESLGSKINEEPAAFAGSVQASVAFVAAILVAFGVAIPPTVIPLFLGALAAWLGFWTRKKVTPAFNADDSEGFTGDDADFDPDKIAAGFSGFNADGSSVGVDN